MARLTQWATSRGLAVDEVITEVGSGMNAKRRKLARVLADPTAATVVIEHRGRTAWTPDGHSRWRPSARGRRHRRPGLGGRGHRTGPLEPLLTAQGMEPLSRWTSRPPSLLVFEAAPAGPVILTR